MLKQLNFTFDIIFADPPYFLSNGEFCCQSGKVVCVDKGVWDKAESEEYVDIFNYQWLALCEDKLKDNGAIWITGTYHNIFSIAKTLKELGFKILNVITWVKTNPPQTFHAGILHIQEKCWNPKRFVVILFYDLRIWGKYKDTKLLIAKKGISQIGDAFDIERMREKKKRLRGLCSS